MSTADTLTHPQQEAEGAKAPAAPSPVRLNLGSGDKVIPGYISVDRMYGQEVCPLDGYEDNSVDEIRASHVLEHFTHRDVSAVVNHWFEKLKPGGVMKIAVPNFEWIAKKYLDGEPVNVQGYTMGGHADANDMHGSIFDRETLTEVMVNAGLERIRHWKSEIEDCASLPVSLNLMGHKPAAPIYTAPCVIACLSAPRIGHVAHFGCAERAFAPLGIKYHISIGAYWHQVLCQAMEKAVDNPDCLFVLTCDYDTIFDRQDVLELYRLMLAYPETDAIAALQMRRGGDTPLMFMRDEENKPRSHIHWEELDRNLVEVHSAHFGLTMIRKSSLEKLPHPWMLPEPNKDGKWYKGQHDADATFWTKWRKAGFKVHIAPRVQIGHIQEFVTWPDQILKPLNQSYDDWLEKGRPEGLFGS